MDSQAWGPVGDPGKGPALSNRQRDAGLLLDAADHLYAAAALLEELFRRLSAQA